MSSLYVEVLPLALGAAASPAVLTLELLILSGKTQPKARAWLYALGSVLVLLAFSFLAVTVMRNLTQTSDEPPNPWSIAAKALIALALLALALRQLHPKKTAGEAHQSRVAAKMETAKLPFFLLVGMIAMLSNLSTLVLYIPAIHLITHSTADDATKWGAAVMLLLITSAPFVLPVLAVTIVGHRSDALLARVNAFTGRHSRQINAAICFVFAALLGYSAVKELLS
jgi:Sap, sulfolipid-1-addressing protein